MKSHVPSASYRRLLLAACLSAPVLAAADPLYKWSFDSGSAGVPVITAGGGTFVANGTANFLAPGVSGNAGDNALDVSNAYTGGGGAGNSVAAGGANVLTGVGTLSTFTVTMWVKLTAGDLANFPRLLQLGATATPDSGSNPGVNLLVNSGNLEIGVNGRTAQVAAGLSAGAWKFIVFTYDGTAANPYFSPTNSTLYARNNNAVVLTGSLGNSVAAIGSSGLNTGAAGSFNVSPGPVSIGAAGTLYLGNRADGNRGYTGQIDDVRIYNTQLTLAELEAIRLESAPPPPEGGVPYYWKGDAGADWTGANWTSDLEGATPAVLPADGTAAATFAATGATNFATTTLGAAQSVKSLAFNTQATAAVIGGTHALTIGAGGIAIASDAGAVTIDTTGDIVLGANQTWANQSASAFTVASAITGPFVLTTAGTGQTLLSTANTHAGTTTQAGTLTLGNALALGPVDASLNVEGGTLDLNGFSPQVGALGGTTLGTITNRAEGTTSTLVVTTPDATEDTFSGHLNNGSATQIVGLTKAGAGTLILGSTGNFTGNVLVSGGTLAANVALFVTPLNTSIGQAQTPGRTVTIQNGATFRFGNTNVLGIGLGDIGSLPDFVVESGGTITATRYNLIGDLFLNGGTLVNSSTDTGTHLGYQFKGAVTVGGAAASVISTTTAKANHLDFNTVFEVGAASSLTISAPLANQSGDFTNAEGGFTKTGPGMLTLGADNTYTGPTTLGAGKLVLTTTNALSNTAAFAVSTSAATLELAYTGTEIVGDFSIDGVSPGPGTYGRLGSGATHTYAWITGDGLISVPVAVPAAPANLAATGGAGQIALSWDSSAGATSYTVQSGTASGGPYATVATGLASTAYTHTGLSAGTTYYYVVTATNAGGDSAASNEASATTSSLTAQQTWRNLHFGVTTSTGNAADGADPDGDGFVNLLEYALGGDPLASDPAIRPLVGKNGSGHLTLAFSRIADSSLRYSVVASATLVAGSWTEVWFSTGTDNTAGSVTVADPEPLSAHARRFLRLEVQGETTP